MRPAGPTAPITGAARETGRALAAAAFYGRMDDPKRLTGKAMSLADDKEIRVVSLC